jgi:urease accessory protein
LTRPLAHTDLPLLAAAHRLWSSTEEEQDGAALTLSAKVHALRETKELRDEERHLGSSLARVLHRLELEQAEPFVGHPQASYVVMYGLAAARWDVSLPDALVGFGFAWLENQIAAASRLIPLGQLDAQELLSRLLLLLPELAARAESLSEDEIGQTVPAFALASSWHEQQYSRLFRS